MKLIFTFAILVCFSSAISATELNAKSSQIIRGLVIGECISGLKEEVSNLNVSQVSVNSYCDCSATSLTGVITEEDWQQMVLGKLAIDSEEYKQKALSASDGCSEHLIK